jgi:hypothetical protein
VTCSLKTESVGSRSSTGPNLSVRHGTQALAAQLGRPFYGCFANLL